MPGCFLSTLFLQYFSHESFNPWTYTQIHTPTMVQGGLMEPLPKVFDMLLYFETILPFLQDEVYFMGGGAAGGL